MNNEKIFKSDIDRLLKVARTSDKSLQGDSVEARKKLEDVRQQLIASRIDLILWMQEAKRRKIVPAQGDVDQFVAQNKSQFRTNAQWVEFLNGRSEADYRKTIAQEMAIAELFARLTADVNVTDEEVRAYYDANKDKFQVPEMVRVHHIFFILPKNADQTEKSRVLAQANDVLKKAQAPGANFEALAREYSQANDVMKDSGGLPLFWRDGTPLPKEFQDAAFGGKAGQVVGPVQTGMGLHIIKIDEKIPSGPAPLSVDIRRDIRLALKTQKNDTLLNNFLADLNMKADIKRMG